MEYLLLGENPGLRRRRYRIAHFDMSHASISKRLSCSIFLVTKKPVPYYSNNIPDDFRLPVVRFSTPIALSNFSYYSIQYHKLSLKYSIMLYLIFSLVGYIHPQTIREKIASYHCAAAVTGVRPRAKRISLRNTSITIMGEKMSSSGNTCHGDVGKTGPHLAATIAT